MNGEPVLHAMTPGSERIARKIQPKYTLANLVEIEGIISPALEIALNEWGRVCASNREVEGTDPTNYDAVWVRDSVWIYLALAQSQETLEPAAVVLNSLTQYFSTAAQRKRLENIIACPSLAEGPNGPMEVVHIRFDGTSPEFNDVQVNGRDQFWNHKQSDALGLYYLAVGEALLSGKQSVDSLTAEAWQFLLRLPLYWDRLPFENHEDAGAWEEIERINTSSIGIVTRSLEIWKKVSASSLAIPWLGDQSAAAFSSHLESLIERGYGRIRKQLPFESPDYPVSSAKYREADAALLSLLYPAGLERLTIEEKRSILECVRTLVRERGVLRYVGDAYQSGNYWLQEEQGTETDSRTEDHSSPEAFQARSNRFIPDTEAEWFFDSWISICFGLLYQVSGERADLDLQTTHFNRALCQLTGDDDLGADGNPVEEFSLPESYNTVVQNGERAYAPSPITPLNWSKASLALALRTLRSSLQSLSH
jgi:hypothetical protein